MKSKALLCALVAFVVIALSASPLHAQATRTWVSGVGDDANPCSRTAPCKTFAGAISKTAAGGEISVLDPGGFAPVTITKSITITGDGTLASILATGGNAVVVNAGVNDRVVLRGLSIEGAGTNLNGIRFIAGGSLHVIDCTIDGFRSVNTVAGIDFEPGGNSKLFVRNTVISNNGTGATGGGILIKPTGVGTAIVALDNVQITDNIFGLKVQDNSKVTVRNSLISGNTNEGITATQVAGSPVSILVESSQSSHNGTGVLSSGGQASVRLADTTITGNGTGLKSNLFGLIGTFGTNNNIGNATGMDGAPTAAATPRQ